MKLKYFSMIAIFLISFGFLGASFYQPVMASEIPNDVIVTTENEEPNYKQERAIGITTALIWAAKVFGTAAVVFVAKVIYSMGLRTACKKYNDSNAVWDYVCDATNQYRD